jgi:hypothetical protein
MRLFAARSCYKTKLDAAATLTNRNTHKRLVCHIGVRTLRPTIGIEEKSPSEQLSNLFEQDIREHSTGEMRHYNEVTGPCFAHCLQWRHKLKRFAERRV